MSHQPKSLAHVDTIYSADSIEWCPFEGYQDIFVCGTYQVLEPKQPDLSQTSNASEESTEDDGDDRIDEAPKQTERTGRVLLCQVDQDSQESLREVQRVETAAILDSKWSPRLSSIGQPVLAVGDAKGAITIFELSSQQYSLREVETVQVDEETMLCLSLDWSDRFSTSSSEPSIVTSLSTGSLAHLLPSPAGYQESQKWKAHDYEPWITAFDQWDRNLVWSGGDDCKLKSWDLRDTSRPAFVNKKYVCADVHRHSWWSRKEGRFADRSFDAGVTTITPSPHNPHLLAVGSYDSSLRLFDSRNARSPLCTIPTAGGIWRTRFHPSPERKGDLLLACMHGGFSVVHLQDAFLFAPGATAPAEAEESWKEIASFTEHSSLAYGADWSRLPRRDGQSLVATCSFYDHSLHLWRA